MARIMERAEVSFISPPSSIISRYGLCLWSSHFFTYLKAEEWDGTGMCRSVTPGPICFDATEVSEDQALGSMWRKVEFQYNPDLVEVLTL